MKKIVTGSSFSGRIELDGSEYAIRFDTPYRCFEVLNEGDGDVVVSLTSGAADGDIGSVTVPAGSRVQYAHGRLDVDTVYITGSGTVQVAGKNHMGQTFCPAVSAVAESEPRVEKLSYSELAMGFIGGGGVYNQSGMPAAVKNRLTLYKSWSGYGVMSSEAVDFTRVKKLVIYGAVINDSSTLSGTGYVLISDTPVTAVDDIGQWTEVFTHTGNVDAPFSHELDVSGMTGEKYICFAVFHGTETSSNTSYMCIDEIHFM